ncbi:MAG: metallophosphoesterase family protein [Gemmatimonadetes bacterium]|nr:metallophosphoesterase family protein [Gemmatimonadota bacterium]
MKLVSLILLLCQLTLGAHQARAGIRHTYLTWQADPSSSISVNVQTLHQPGQPPPQITVVYDTVLAAAPSAYRWASAATNVDPIDALPGRTVHSVVLHDLLPGQRYHYRVLSSQDAASRVYHFRTIHDEPKPLRFIAGGDMGIDENAQRLQAVAAAQNPQFALIGGDLAYANGDWSQTRVWDRWFDIWDSLMVTPSGNQIPIVAAIGNHEVRGGYAGNVQDAGPYLRFLPQSPTPYYERSIGPHMGLIVLDSGHLTPHAGVQTDWLRRALEGHSDRPLCLVAYHVPLFPGFRLPSGAMPSAGREFWQPLFEQYNITAALEHHDHIFKRTVLIRGDEETEDGILYLGDGAFGRPTKPVEGPRQVHLGRRWYLHKLESRGHFWRVDVDAAGASATFTALDEEGIEFDQVTRLAR